MDELWEQVQRLLGQEVDSGGQRRRPFVVAAVDEESLTVRRPVTRRWRDATGALSWEHVIPRDELEAVARLGLEGDTLTSSEARKHRVIGSSLGYVVAILRAIEPHEEPEFGGE